MEAELETLRKEREDKVRQIAEKRRQVEELKQRRAARADKASASGGAAASEGRRGSDVVRAVDDLLAEVLRSGDAPAASPDGPLRQLATSAPRRGNVQMQVECAVAAVTVQSTEGDVYERAVQTDLSGEEVGKGATSVLKTSGATSVLMKMAERARQRPVKPEDGGGGGVGRMLKRSVHPDKKDGDLVPDSIAEEASAAMQADAKQAAAGGKAELSVEERERIMKLPDFQGFFDRATLLVERVLGAESWDVAADFTGGDQGDGAEGGADVDTARMKHVDNFIEDRWSLGRPVTDVRFSPRQPELFLAAYGQRENPSRSDPDGCMLVWNLAMRQRPEFTFSCQSAVLTAQFHRFNPSLFFGGTYAGGVVLWDARAKAGPVQRTPLSPKGHSYPVQAMQQVGTQNATNIVTASNDGRLCVWSLAMLVHPQEFIDLKNDTKSAQNRRDLAVMTLSFPENETNILYVGAEDGSVCQVHIHGSKVGVTESYDGHDGPVTGIDLHPHGEASQHGVESASEMALSCSFDWSIKLWMVKQFQSPVLSLDAFEDYIYDVRWHPSHPAAFASVDGEGHVDLWNLNRDLESPVVRCENPQGKKNALNRCDWSMDGKRLAAGDSEGTLSVYHVDKSISTPKNEDFQHFQERIRTFQPIVPRARDAGYGMDSRYGLPARNYAGGGGLA